MKDELSKLKSSLSKSEDFKKGIANKQIPDFRSSRLSKSDNAKYELFNKSIPISTAGVIHEEYIDSNRSNIPGSIPILENIEYLLTESEEALLLENGEQISI